VLVLVLRVCEYVNYVLVNVQMGLDSVHFIEYLSHIRFNVTLMDVCGVISLNVCLV
jgi:hypothetical protein